jgi:hypothetical protein
MKVSNSKLAIDKIISKCGMEQVDVVKDINY